MVGDLCLADLRTLLFQLNNEEASLPLIKSYEKEDLLAIFEYIMGLTRDEALETRNRSLTVSIYIYISMITTIVFFPGHFADSCGPLP